MSLAIIHTRAQSGIEAPAVTVEVHISNGLPSMSIVGLPETAVKESRDRVRSALINSHFDFPARRVTVNLAPADLPKEGGRYDLAIALGILVASEQLPGTNMQLVECYGELALSGELRNTAGLFPSAIAAGQAERAVICPFLNANEASLASNTTVYAANNLLEVCAHLNGAETLHRQTFKNKKAADKAPDLSEVIGQPQAKRVLEITAAGGHNLLMSGPPGTGKSMLASRLPGLLPPLPNEEMQQVAAIYSTAGLGLRPNLHQPPFRNPHHTASATALVGGGSSPKPGEISLAHNGVLFLDELPEYSRQVLEVLREPMESGEILISRIRAQTRFPSRFQLIAAMNPCPCGYLGSERCRCTPDQIHRYQQKISGPLLDRIDLQITIPRVPSKELLSANPSGESSKEVRQRIILARQNQLGRSGKINAYLSAKEVARYCELSTNPKQLLLNAAERLNLSGRGIHRVIKVARTIADLAAKRMIQETHVAEALSYRIHSHQEMNK